MYSMLEGFAERNNVPKDMIRRQLLAEFGVDVENTPVESEDRPSAPLDEDELQTLITALGGL